MPNFNRIILNCLMLHITKKYNPKKDIFPTKFRLTRVKLKDWFLITARKVNRDSVIPRRHILNFFMRECFISK